VITMPMYDYMCDNEECPSNINLPSGVEKGFEAFLTYEEKKQLEKGGSICPICDKGQIKEVFTKMPLYGRTNQPEHLKKMVKDRADWHAKNKTQGGSPASIYGWEGQNAMAIKKGLKPIDPPKKQS